MKTITFTFIALLVSLCSFAQTITAVTPSDQIQGTRIVVKFNTNFAPKYSIPTGGSNTTLTAYFQVELSDATGNFGTNPRIITTNAIVPSLGTPNGVPSTATIIGVACNEPNQTVSGIYSVNAQLSSDIPTGNCYKLRVVCKQEYLIWSSPYTYGPNPTQNTPNRGVVESGCFRVLPFGMAVQNPGSMRRTQ